MFLRRNWRNRAIGLIGAYAVLIAGIAASGAFELPRLPARATVEHAPENPETKRADDCSSALEDRRETVC